MARHLDPAIDKGGLRSEACNDGALKSSIRARLVGQISCMYVTVIRARGFRFSTDTPLSTPTDPIQKEHRNMRDGQT